MNTLESNRYTSAWQALGRSLPRPRAVLTISAHWYVNGTAVTAMRQPRVIHDFYGFPRELFEFDYPAPGSPEVAHEIAAMLGPTYVGLDEDSWGLDHGTWSVLAHIFPKADVPVVQLSIHAGEEIGYHFALGERLAALRERGVFILGSGNVVHNLRKLDWSRPDAAFDWAKRFDEAGRRLMTSTPGEILRLTGEPEYPQAVPTPDHFIPLLYIAGVAKAAGHAADVLVDGYSMGSLSMTCYVVDGPGPRLHDRGRPVGRLHRRPHQRVPQWREGRLAGAQQRVRQDL